MLNTCRPFMITSEPRRVGGWLSLSPPPELLLRSELEKLWRSLRSSSWDSTWE